MAVVGHGARAVKPWSVRTRAATRRAALDRPLLRAVPAVGDRTDHHQHAHPGLRGARRRLASAPRRHPHGAAFSVEGAAERAAAYRLPRARMRATLGRARACATAPPTTVRDALASR